MCRWPEVAVITLMALLWQPSTALADGWVRINHGTVYLRDGVWYLDARVDYRLSEAARDALRNGVPLELRLDVEVLRPGWVWWETTVASLAQRYRLQFHALSERYVLLQLNSGESRSFRSLARMLDAAGEVRALPVIDAELLSADERHTVAVRAGLDTDALPRPLRPMAYISPQWHLESDWQRWPLGSS